MGTTTPDNVYFPDTSVPWATTADFSTMASSVQNALNNRQRYDFEWPSVSAQSLQTGMRQGDRGYIAGNRSEYIYDNGAWRLATPYAEFTSGTATSATTAYIASSAISINSGTSTSTIFATASGSVITLSDPGVYALSMYCVASVQVANAFAMVGIASDATTNFASQIGRAPFGSDNVANLTTFYRFSASGGQLYFYWKQNDTTSRNYTSTIRLLRLA